MARSADSDIAWRTQTLAAALRAAVGDESPMDALGLGFKYLGEKDAKTSALANALIRAATFEIDTHSEKSKLRARACEQTRKLSDAVRAWSRLLEPIVADNRARNGQLGANARIFTAHAIPDLVDSISSVVDSLVKLEYLLAMQLNFPEMVTRRRGKPTDHVLNEITQDLHAAGFTPKEIADLTDREAGDKIKRVRHRLGIRRPRSGQSGAVASDGGPRRKHRAVPAKLRQ